MVLPRIPAASRHKDRNNLALGNRQLTNSAEKVTFRKFPGKFRFTPSLYNALIASIMHKKATFSEIMK